MFGLYAHQMFTSMYEFFVEPFVQFGFMRRALVACVALGLGAGAVGLFLVLRRMTLIGDAMSHAIMPGAALGFLLYGGVSLFAMGLGGLVAGSLVVIGSSLVNRKTKLAEDASFGAFHIASLALGVLLISLGGSNIDLMQILFGSILSIDNQTIMLVAGIATFSMISLALLFRSLVMDSFDTKFLSVVSGRGAVTQNLFMLLVVINLVSGFEAVGTLMSVGIIIIPSITSILWSNKISAMIIISTLNISASTYIGLVLSYHLNIPSSSAIILVLTLFYVISLMLTTKKNKQTTLELNNEN